MSKSIVLTERRVPWMDGLKGIVCLNVFIHHFLLAFYPETYFGVTTRAGKQFSDLAQSPFMFWANGNFCVCIFLMISGILVSKKVLNVIDKTQISDILIKQWAKLSFPLFIVSFIVYIFLRFSFFSNVEVAEITASPWLSEYYTTMPPLKDVFITSFISVWFGGNSTFSTAFWMLYYIMVGNGICILLCSVLWKYPQKALIICGVFALFMIIMNSMYAVSAFAVIIAYLDNRNSFSNQCKNKLGIGIILGITGLFLGGYPTGIHPDNVYSILDYFPILGSSVQLIHIIGTFFFLCAIFILKKVQKVLGSKLFTFFGEISYAVYLLHIPILFSFSTSLFRKCYSMMNNYIHSVCITFIVSLFFLVCLSYIFNRYIISFWNKIVDSIIRK